MIFLDNTKVSNKNDNLKVEEPKNVLEENVERKLYKDTMKCNVEDEKCEFQSKRSVSTNSSTTYFVLYNKLYFSNIFILAYLLFLIITYIFQTN